MSSILLQYGALILSLLPLFFGLGALFRPEKLMAAVQFPVPTGAAERKIALSLMRFFGTRNIGICYLMLLNWFRADETQIGLGLIACIWLTTMDGLISRWTIGGGEWNNWIYLPVTIGVTGCLLRLFG